MAAYTFTQETENFTRNTLVISDLFPRILRNILQNKISEGDIYRIYSNSSLSLCREQEQLLTTVHVDGYRKCDISLLYTLIRNLTIGLSPTLGWGRKPTSKIQVTIGDDLERIRDIRNCVYGHRCSASVRNTEHARLWSVYEDICRRMDGHYGDNEFSTILKNIEEMELGPHALFNARKKLDNQMKKDLDTCVFSINHHETTRIPVSPLQSCNNLPIWKLYAPVSIRRDLEMRNCKRRGHDFGGVESALKYVKHVVKRPEDLFLVNGSQARFVIMLGDAAYGKSVYCLRLVEWWCAAKQSQKSGMGLNYLSDWQKYLGSFAYLFLVQLRHVNRSCTGVTEMICNHTFKFHTECHDAIRQVLRSKQYRCLVILDGLDEWKVDDDVKSKLTERGIPNFDNLSECLVFVTMRRWKFDAVATMLRDCDRVVEIEGLDERGFEYVLENILTHHYQLDKESTHYATTYQDILLARKSTNEQFQSLLQIPMLAITYIQIMYERKNVGQSLTDFYVNLVDLLIKRALKKGNLDRRMPALKHGVVLPKKLQRNQNFCNFIDVLLKLGEIAYNDLVSHETHLVFQKEDLIRKIGEEVFDIALEVGLLSKCDAPGCFNEANISLNFFHKSLEEFLAAVFVVVNVTPCSFLRHLSNVHAILELSNVLIFIIGIQPCFQILQRIIDVAQTDEGIRHYRETLDIKEWNKVFVFYNLQFAFSNEMNYVVDRAQKLAINTGVLDVYLHNVHSGKEVIRETSELLRHQHDKIMSLFLLVIPEHEETGISKETLTEFLIRTNRLESLYLNKRSLGRLNVPSLRVLELWNVELSNDDPSLEDTSLISNLTNLERLVLCFSNVRTGSLEVKSEMKKLKSIWLYEVKLPSRGLDKFVSSLLSINHYVHIKLWETGADTSLLERISSAEEFSVTRNDLQDRFHFSRVSLSREGTEV